MNTRNYRTDTPMHTQKNTPTHMNIHFVDLTFKSTAVNRDQ